MTIGITSASAPGTTTRRVSIAAHVPLAIGAALVALVVLLAVVGGLLTPVDPNLQHLGAVAQPPGGGFLLGTDDLGRDVLSRLLVGARSAVVNGALIAVGTMALGGTLGLLAGFLGGWVDTLVMRGVDLMFALPGLLVAAVVVGMLGGSQVVAVGILIVFFAPWEARVLRGLTLEQRNLPYIEAVRLAGLSRCRIISRHILPNTMPVFVTDLLLNFAFGLVAMSTLTFLGLGIPLGEADWGRMIAEGQGILYQNPSAVLAPGIAIGITAASVSIVGDWVYERLSDRGLRR